VIGSRRSVHRFDRVYRIISLLSKGVRVCSLLA
jgi:hypothetical protein